MNFGLGNILPKLIGFFLIPVYTIFLSPEDYGILDLCIALSTFLVVFMRLGIPGSVTRFYFDFKEGIGLTNYVTTIFRFLIISGLFIVAVFVIICYFSIEYLINGLVFFPFVIWIAYESLGSSATDLQRRLIQAREQSSYSMKLNVAMTLVGVPLSILFVVGFKLGLGGIIIASTISTTIFLFQALYYLKDDISGRYDSSLLKPSFRYGISIFPSHIMGNVAPLVNRALLSNLGSLSAVGLLGIASKFTSPLLIIVTAFQNAYLPVYYSIRTENVAGDIDRLASLSKKIWFLACLFFLAVVLLGPPLIHLLTPVEYHSSSDLIIYLSIGFLGQVIYTLYGQEIFFSKKTKWVPLLSFCSIGSNLLIVFFFVQDYGAIAVAIGMSASQWISAILGSCISARYFDLKIQIRLIVKTLILLTVLIWLNSQLIEEFTSDMLLIGSSIFLVLLFAIIVVWSEAEFRLITRNLTKRLEVKLFKK